MARYSSGGPVPRYPHYPSRRHPAPSGDGCLVVIGFAVILAVIASLVFGVVAAFHVTEHGPCTVVEKDRTRTDSGSDMRVYTENCGNFKVADSLLSWTWSSSDTYREIEVGETYEFKTRGFRVPFLSAFPNIVEAEEVK